MLKGKTDNLTKILTALIICSVMVLFSACEKSYSNEIDFSDETFSYSKETTKLVNETVEDLVYKIAKVKYSSITRTSDEIIETTEKIEKIVVKIKVKEEDYTGFFERLKSNADKIVLSYEEIVNDEINEETYDILTETYKDVISVFGYEGFGNVIYNLFLMSLSNEVEDCRERLNKYYSDKDLREYYQRRLDEAESDKETFLTIDISMFTKLLKSGSIILNFITESDVGSISSIKGTFSNEEIKVFIKQIDFDIEFNAEQWEILFSKASDFSNVLGALCKILVKKDDTEKAGNTLNKVFKLLESIQKGLTSGAIESLLTSDKEAFADEVIKVMTEDDKNLTDEIFALRLTGNEYTDWLEKYEELEDICSAEKKSFDDLLTAESGTRIQIIKGMFRGIFDD